MSLKQQLKFVFELDLQAYSFTGMEHKSIFNEKFTLNDNNGIVNEMRMEMNIFSQPHSFI
jgi:hypothetical protein